MSKQAKLKTQRRKVGDFLFVFYEADDSAYVHAIQNQIPCGLILYIDAINPNQICVAHYERIWEERPNPVHLENFIHKFSKEGDYRDSYRVNGMKIIEDFQIGKQDMIDPRTYKAIQRINFAPPHTLAFRDFANLKTYGKDSISKMRMEELQGEVTQAELTEIKGQVPPEMVLLVLRWIKRGLRLDHAIHKVKCDLEISQNAKTYHS